MNGCLKCLGQIENLICRSDRSSLKSSKYFGVWIDQSLPKYMPQSLQYLWQSLCKILRNSLNCCDEVQLSFGLVKFRTCVGTYFSRCNVVSFELSTQVFCVFNVFRCHHIWHERINLTSIVTHSKSHQ